MLAALYRINHHQGKLLSEMCCCSHILQNLAGEETPVIHWTKTSTIQSIRHQL